MFKKKCPNCDKKVEKKFDFCPYCSSILRNPNEYGVLGKNDEDNFNDIFDKKQNAGIPNLGGMLGGNIFSKVFTSAFKMLENEIRSLDEQEKQLARQEKTKFNQNSPKINTDFQLFINGKKVNLPENMSLPMQFQTRNTQKTEEPKKQKIPEISQETIQKSIKLPRKEAKSKLTRLKNRVVYELDTPGLDSVNNVVINKLEGAIEIKAFTEKAVFYKTLPIKLALTQYSINPIQGKLILEFKV